MRKRTKVERLQLSNLPWNRSITREVARRFLLFEISLKLLVKFSTPDYVKRGFGFPNGATSLTAHLQALAVWVLLTPQTFGRGFISAFWPRTTLNPYELVCGMQWTIAHVLAEPEAGAAGPVRPRSRAEPWCPTTTASRLGVRCGRAAAAAPSTQCLRCVLQCISKCAAETEVKRSCHAVHSIIAISFILLEECVIL